MLTTVKTNLVIEPVDAVEQNGFYVPLTNDNLVRGTVVAQGPEVKEVQNGNSVIFKKNSSTEIEVTGKKYFVTELHNILAIVG